MSLSIETKIYFKCNGECESIDYYPGVPAKPE